jgi:hypothetical protein
MPVFRPCQFFACPPLLSRYFLSHFSSAMQLFVFVTNENIEQEIWCVGKTIVS